MKKYNIFYFGAILVAMSLLVVNCAKEEAKTTTTTTTADPYSTLTAPVGTSGVETSDITIAQDAETQDAVSDQVEQNVDADIESIETQGFDFSTEKSTNVTINRKLITGDTVTTDKGIWPKVIEITYTANKDTLNGEDVVITGSIIVTLNIDKNKLGFWRSRISRSVEFKEFKVTTELSSYTLNGTRKMKRNSIEKTVVDTLRYKQVVKDSITVDLKLAIVYDSVGNKITKTITRKVNKLREITSYFQGFRVKATLKRPSYILWIYEKKSDSIVVSGTISGVNAKGLTYERTFENLTTKIMNCSGKSIPVLVGKVIFKVNKNTPYEINYELDGCKNKIMISRDNKKVELKRKINSKM